MTRRLRAIPVPVVVGVVTALWAVWLARWSLEVDSYVWLIDELLYAKTADFYTDGLHLRPALYGATQNVPNALYPLLLSPLWGLFSSVTAFHIAHAFNAIAFASTLVPVYLLARRVLGLPWGYALAAGMASVAIPWAVAVHVVMSESLAYPLFAWALYAMARALARPGWRTDLVAIVAIGAAVLARNQFFLLGIVFVVAALLLATSTVTPDGARTSVRDRLRAHVLLFALALLGVLLLIVLLAAGVDVAGAYSDALGHPAFPPGIWVATGRHLAHLVVGVGILPAILFFAWLARALVAPATRAEHGFAVIALPAFAIFAWQVGYFAQNVAGGGYQERYVFYLVPLLAVGSVALIAEARRAVSLASIAFGAVIAVVFIASADPQYPAGESLSAFSRVANAGSAFNQVLEGQIEVWSGRLLGRPMSTLDGLVVIAGLLAVAAAVLLVPRWARWARPLLAVVVVLGGAVQAVKLVPESARAINSSYPFVLPHVRESPRDWVDQAAPDDARVAMLPMFVNVGSETLQWQWHAFWNKRVERLFELGGRPEIGFTTTEVQVDAASGELKTDQGDITHLVVSTVDPTIRLRGRVLTRHADGSALIEPAKPWQADWQVDGLGTPRQRLLVYPRTAGEEVRGSVDLVLRLADEVKDAATVRVQGEGRAVERRLEPGSEVTVTARFAARGGAPGTVAIDTTSEGRKPAAVTVKQAELDR